MRLIVLGFVLLLLLMGNSWADSREVYVGVFREGAPGNMNYIEKYVEQVGKMPAVVMWYQDWNQNFPWQDALKVVEYGAMPQIVWEPWYWSDHSKINLNDIISGQWDRYIETWAKEIKNFRHPLFLRLAHEFNIEGYPWGLVNNDKDPNQYIKAYRHVVDIFKKANVTNVRWVWCYMNFSFPDESWNEWEAAYPGDAYVDWVGIDGYNWGTTQDWSSWQSFKYLFQEQVRRSKNLWPTKPIMVAEFASAAIGGDKAQWISEIPGYLKSSLRGVDLIIWFDEKKETDWRIKSDAKSLAAYQQIMKDPLFLSAGADLATFKPAVQPTAAAKQIARALPAQGEVKIDGDLADWDTSAPIKMADSSFFKEGGSWQGLDDLSGQAYLMWDAVNLYLAAEVTDQKPFINKQTGQNIWNGDALEMVISADPAAPQARTAFGSRDFQFGFGTGDGKSRKPEIWNWQRRRSPQGSVVAVKKTSQGYCLEAKIPWAFMKPKAAPASGLKLGFDLAFDDADSSGLRERQFIWNGDYLFYKDPSVWGILELK